MNVVSDRYFMMAQSLGEGVFLGRMLGPPLLLGERPRACGDDPDPYFIQSSPKAEKA